MYDTESDPYCHPGTTIRVNKLNLRDQALLDAFEEEMVLTRSEEALPSGRLTVRQYLAGYRHFFQDVYGCAGRIRTVEVSKGGSAFCRIEFIDAQLKKLFAWLAARDRLKDLSRPEFVEGAAHFLSELNVIHPFRDGNGRAQMTFMAEMARRAGHPLSLERLEREAFIPAMIESYRGDLTPLVDQFDVLTRP